MTYKGIGEYRAITLTTGTDNFTGASGNDIFNAVYDGAATSTFNVSDVLAGGTGTDVLNITATDDAVITLPGALVSGIETVNIRNVDGDATAQILTVNASNFVGATSFNSDRSTDSVTFSNLATGAAIGVIGNGTVAGGAVAGAYATATNAVTLNIADGTKMTTGVTVTGTATSATINSTGAANTIGTVDLANASLTSVTINAATNLKGDILSEATDQVGTNGTVTISGAATTVEFTAALDNTIKTFNASGLTAGGVIATLGTGTEDVKGGAGVDTVTLGAAVKTANFGDGADVVTTAATTAASAVIDGGAGTDTLVLAAVNDVTTSAKGAQYTNFETLRLNASQDVSVVGGITALELNAMTSQTVSKISATQAAAITVRGDQTTALTLTLADATGTADAVSLNLKSATATSHVDVAGLSVVGVETLNIAASTGVGGSSDVAFGVGGADKLTTINVSGAVASKITGTNTAKAITLNSTATGAVTVDGDWVSGSSFTLGAGKDTVTLGSGFNTYNSGAGDDTFNATAAQLNTGANYNVLNGGEGSDTLNITGGAALTIVDNNLRNVTNIEKIVIATTAANSQSISTGGWFDSGFKASGVDLTTTSTTGNITIDMTSFTGAAKISATTVGTAGGEGKIDIQTGSGADTITVSAAALGDAGVIKTFAGNDTITTTGSEAFTITGGAGNDTIILNSTGANTVVFEATAALNGVDTITGFDKTTDIINWVQGASEVAVTGTLTTTADAFYQLGGLAAGKADSAAEVATAITAAATWTAAAVTAWIAVSDDNSTAIYEWKDVAGTNGVQAAELTLVGTFDAAMSTAELATAITIV